MRSCGEVFGIYESLVIVYGGWGGVGGGWVGGVGGVGVGGGGGGGGGRWAPAYGLVRAAQEG